MSDTIKKYLLDENNKPVDLAIKFPSKHAFAVEELTFCLGCVDNVTACASGHAVNLTANQVSNALEQVTLATENMNNHFLQLQAEQARLDRDKTEFSMYKKEQIKEIEEMRKEGIPLYVKVGSFILGGILLILGRLSDVAF